MAVARDLVERFGDRLARWAMVRPRQPESLPIRIVRNRIYVLPTGFGLFLAAIFGAMLLGALNYNNNPALILTFLLVSVAHNSLVHSHLLMSGVRLTALHAEPVHAGSVLTLRLLFVADGGRARPGMELVDAATRVDFDIPAQEPVEVVLGQKAPRRGWHDVGRLRLSTLRPLGLARAWSWLRPDTRLLVYAAPEANAPPLPDSGGEGESQRTRAHGEQPHHLREYRPGDSRRQVAWKASARADRMLVREYEATAQRDVALDWFQLPGLDSETRIRRLTRWVLDAERGGGRYSLRIPGEFLAAGRGAEHRHACLRALALLPHG